MLLDTHLLLWAADFSPDRKSGLSPAALLLIRDTANSLCFSPVSIWEVAIKKAQGRSDFHADPHTLRRALLDSDYLEVPITSEHAAGVMLLPAIHKDPFDRLLIAQAAAEGITLLTADAKIAAYDGPIRRV
ncbi:MAG TPA: type II toxin-antitoxin system VapC family toxin [Caulobacteraceae bacterium]|nr:type II toxin-antitoxin system VapC family toxin [Caulobacteraceae bacterium]